MDAEVCKKKAPTMGEKKAFTSLLTRLIAAFLLHKVDPRSPSTFDPLKMMFQKCGKNGWIRDVKAGIDQVY